MDDVTRTPDSIRYKLINEHNKTHLDAETCRNRGCTVAPNIKNFKNLKYVEKINDMYTVTKKLG